MTRDADNSTDASFMRRAIRLAMNGRGRVEPNPMVGCVIVKDGRVIGEGFHREYGGPHAEPAALASCTESPAGATAYVTLEPCCHINKKTPPCAPQLIEAKVARVVVGCLDPNPDVNGKGIAMLRAAGIEVGGPVLEPEAKQLIAPFLARVRFGRPYVTLKWAESSDGRVAGPGGQRVQISNAASTRCVHDLRARCDAIVVGARTVVTDDPLLTARGVEHPRELIRVVVDRDLIIPPASRLVFTAREQPLIVYCSDSAHVSKAATVETLKRHGVDVRAIPIAGSRLILRGIVEDLGARGATNVLVEPGPRLTDGFFADGVVDRVWVICSSRPIGDPTAPAASSLWPYRRTSLSDRVDPMGPAMCYLEVGRIDLDGDELTEHLNGLSPVYFSPQPSADFAGISVRP